MPTFAPSRWIRLLLKLLGPGPDCRGPTMTRQAPHDWQCCGGHRHVCCIVCQPLRLPGKLIVKNVQFGSVERFFPAYPRSIEPMSSCVEARSSGLVEKKTLMTHGTHKPTPKLRKAPQPPLSHAGAVPDSDRAKRPPLSEASATGSDLSPGDRVEGLGNFGKPNGEFGTVERANEEDAVVKWDDDGRMRIHQPSLKKA